MTTSVATPAGGVSSTPFDGRVSIARGARRLSRRVASDFVGLIDATAVILGGLLVSWLLQGQVPDLGPAKALQLGLLSSIILRLVLDRLGMYGPSLLHDFPVAPGRLLLAVAISLAAVLGIWLSSASSAKLAAQVAVVWLLATYALMLLCRFTARRVLARMTAEGAFDARVAVYGSTGIAKRVEQHLQSGTLGIHFAGLFDERRDMARRHGAEPSLAGNFADLVDLARRDLVDHIVIALPQAADRRIEEIVQKLEQLPVGLSIVTHISSDLIEAGPGHRVSSLGPVGLIDVKPKPFDGWGTVLKAAEDYVLGSIALLLVAPVMVAVAIAVRLDSSGPILFRQRRKGRNQKVIEVLKFRTMRVMEDGAVVKQATKGDPRITRVGAFLRKSSLDELPQLINVLRGEMSLVGPRPHALAHDDHYGELLSRYVNRHQVKPGITGLAQVMGLRGETETLEKMEARLEKDLAYVNNWSIWLDLRILALTLVRTWSSRNAY